MAGELTFDFGPLQGRVVEATGSFSIAGPDRAGTAHATVITFNLGVTTAGGVARAIGRVVSSMCSRTVSS